MLDSKLHLDSQIERLHQLFLVPLPGAEDP
jgi:hypothetical protein